MTTLATGTSIFFCLFTYWLATVEMQPSCEEKKDVFSEMINV